MSKKNYQREILSLKQSEFSKLLSKAYADAYLHEGIFDSVIDFLGQLASAYASGAGRADLSRLTKVKDGLDPKNNIKDQVAALICVLQSVGYAASGLDQELTYVEESLQSPWDEMEDDQFIEEAKLFLGRASGAYGRVHAWIGAGGSSTDQLRQCSRKVHSIGQKLEEAPEPLHFAFRLLDDVLGELINLNLETQAATIMSQEEAQKAAKEIGGQRFIDETIPFVQMLPQLQLRVREVAENILVIEELMKVKQQKPVEIPAIG